MDGWKSTACCVLCLLAAGCRTDPAVIALERECRMLEDQVYMLEDELGRAESALEACQSTAPGPSRAREAPSRPGTAGGSPRLPSLRGPQLSPQNGGPRAPVDTRSLQLPEVEVPGQSLPSGEFPKTLRSTPSAAPGEPAPPAAPGGVRRPAAPDAPPDSLPPPYPRKPAASRYYDPRYSQDPYDPRRYAGRDPYAYRDSYAGRDPYAYRDPYAGRDPYASRPAPRPTRVQPPRLVDPQVIPAQAIALDPRADNSRVDRVTLNRALTGGYDRDARSGDAGMAVLVEPRDAQGRLVPAAGPISVVLLDRGLSGSAARVARWDFTAEQTATLYRKTPYGEGFFLEMPWSGNPPVHSHLHLFVRYLTKDRRAVEASREVDVALPAGRGRNWLALTPAAGETQPVRTAGSWQPKPRRYDDPPAQLASAEEPVRAAATRDTEPAAPRSDSSREKAAESRVARRTDCQSVLREAEAAGFQTPADASETTTSDSKPAADPAPAAPPKSKRPVWSPYR